jgi:hypothetical protein
LSSRAWPRSSSATCDCLAAGPPERETFRTLTASLASRIARRHETWPKS